MEGSPISSAGIASGELAQDRARRLRLAELTKEKEGADAAIAELKRADAALRWQNERLQLLSDIACQILSSTSPERIVKELFDRISSQIGLDLYCNYLVANGDGVLHLDSYAGLSEEMARSISTLRFGQELCGTVAQQRQPILVTHMWDSNDPDPKMLLPRRIGLRAYYCNPLLVEDRLLGTLSFGTRSRDEFSPEDLQLLRTFSYYIAIAQDRARARRDLEKLVLERTASLRRTVESLEQVLYHVAHDLRAPLRAMEGFTSILVEKCAPHLDAEGEHLAQLVSSAARRMDRLIQDLLAYGRLGHAVLARSKVCLEAPVQAALTDLEDDLREKQARVEKIQLPLSVVWGNEALLQQILTHLIANAISYVPRKRTPEVRIWAEPRQDRIRLWIQDNGVGIPPEHQERIFRIFERLSLEGENGTGMGLAIVKKGIERMDGEVGVESTPGEGSRFWLELPAAEKESR